MTAKMFLSRSSSFSAAFLRKYVLLFSSYGAVCSVRVDARVAEPCPGAQKYENLCSFYSTHVASAACKSTGVHDYSWYSLISPTFPAWLSPSGPYSYGWSTRSLSSSSTSETDREGVVEEFLCAEIDTPEFVKLVEGGKIQLFDVREPEELEETGRIPGAVNLPLGEVEEALDMSQEAFLAKYGAPRPSKEDTNIVFQCLAGVRSHTAMVTAHLLGYNKARHYIGGWMGWKEYLDTN